MLLVPKHRIAFIHVPKTGGRSISAALTGRNNVSPEHETAAEARECIADWPEWFSFAVVRNPWDRWVSLWWAEFARNHHRGPTLLAFITNRIGEWPMHHDQTTFVDGVSYVGRFERLQDDWDNICWRVNLPFTELPHLNRTSHGQYRVHYCDEARALVARESARDIDRYGYHF